MAGEYSRELSVKVFAGQCRLIELGYRQGGPPGYGLRRSLIDQAGAAKGELARGEHKSIQTDRVVLVPGPARRDRHRSLDVSVVREGGKARERDRRHSQRARDHDRSRPAVDARHGSPGSDQREIHRQQCLEPRLLQAEAEAGSQQPRHVDSRGGRLRADRRPVAVRRRPGDHPRAIAQAVQRRDAGRRCSSCCRTAAISPA